MPANDGPEQELYLLLTDMFYLLDDTDRQFFGEFGLSTRQFWALHHLSETESMSMIDLSRLLFTDKSNITAIADRLETAGLVERKPATQDRRVILLSLTPAGRQRHDQVLAVHQDRIRMLIGNDEEALRQAIHTLEPIRKRLGQYLQTRVPQATTS
jgi:DNA-binding MarR family transcriptional regulator